MIKSGQLQCAGAAALWLCKLYVSRKVVLTSQICTETKLELVAALLLCCIYYMPAYVSKPKGIGCSCFAL